MRSLRFLIQRGIADDRGDAGLFLAMLLPAFVILAGVAHDLGLKFEAQREAYGVASAAARAGAQQIDEDAAYVGRAVLLPEAGLVAKEFADDHGQFTNVRGERVGDLTVSVVGSGQVKMVFLSAIGIDSLNYVVEAEASLVRLSSEDPK